MEGNRISFGFKKTKKADKPVAVNNDERKEYIECVEEQSIKVVGGETEETNEPLVIPMKPNSLITSERMMEIALKVERALEEPEIKTESVTIKIEDPLGDNATLDQMAERELMQEAQKEIVTVTPTMEIPTSTKGVARGEKEKARALMKDTVVLLLDLISQQKVITTKATDSTTNRLKEDAWKRIAEEFCTLTGEIRRPDQLRLKWENLKKAARKRCALKKQNNVKSTLDDYEAIPVKDFGVAMLRGMGWTPGKEGSKYKQPELRPKGLGLGADKVVKAKQQASKDSKPEELVILKNSYVKIVSGKYSDYYGKVVSLDEDNGRVMVDIPVKKEMVSLSEFMMNAVTKSEYDRESKVIRPPKVRLSVDKKQEIIKMHKKKIPVCVIARELKLWRNYVYLCIKRWEKEGAVKAHVPIGCPRKLPANKKAPIINEVQQTELSVTDLASNHGVSTRPVPEPKIEIHEVPIKQQSDDKNIDSKEYRLTKRKKERIITLYKQKHSILAIARHLNVTRNTVNRWITRWEEEGSYNARLNENKKKKIIALYKQKHSLSAIARYLKIARNTVMQWVKRWKNEGVINQHVSGGRPLKLSSNAGALLIEQATQADEVNLSELAATHGVSVSTVRRHLILNGIPYKKKERKIGVRTRKEVPQSAVDDDIGYDGIHEPKKAAYHINVDKRQQIILLHEQKHSVSAIARYLKISIQLKIFLTNSDALFIYNAQNEAYADTYGEYKRKEQSQKSAKEDGNNLSNQRRDGKERDKNDEKESDRRDEKERDRRDEKERDRRDDKERDRRDDKESDRRQDRDMDRRDNQEKDRRDVRERDRRDDRERDRRDERERDRRDERQPARRERKKDEDSGDYRKHRDQDSANGKSNNRFRRDSSSSEDRSSRKKKEKKRYSSNDSLSSLSDDDRKQSKHKSRKRRNRSRSDSRKRSPALEAKRDIDKKRKGKKKKRDRDRSPNYKKHRK